MADVIKSISTRSFFQLGAELRREKYHGDGQKRRHLWIAFLLMFIFFIWAVFVLIKYQSDLPGWVIILGILLLLVPAGPLLTLILVYYVLSRSSKETPFVDELVVEEFCESDSHLPLSSRQRCPIHDH